MNLAGGITRLYPLSMRDSWGADLEEEARRGGLRRLPNLLMGIADVWLHPVIWPANSGAQRRRRAASFAFAVGLVGWLLGHAAAENSLLPVGVARSRGLNLCDALLLIGLVLVVPLPRLSTVAMRRLAKRLVSGVAPPVFLGVVALAWANLATTVPPVLRPILLAAWWLALVLGAVQICRIVADIDPAAVTSPSSTRLGAGLALVAVSFAVAGGIVLRPSLTASPAALASVILGAVLLSLAAACGYTVRDLRVTAAGS